MAAESFSGSWSVCVAVVFVKGNVYVHNVTRA